MNKEERMNVAMEVIGMMKKEFPQHRWSCHVGITTRLKEQVSQTYDMWESVSIYVGTHVESAEYYNFPIEFRMSEFEGLVSFLALADTLEAAMAEVAIKIERLKTPCSLCTV